MIEKLDEGTFRFVPIIAKINELVDAFNEHYHAIEAQDRDITTPAKVVNDESLSSNLGDEQ